MHGVCAAAGFKSSHTVLAAAALPSLQEMLSILCILRELIQFWPLWCINGSVSMSVLSGDNCTWSRRAGGSRGSRVPQNDNQPLGLCPSIPAHPSSLPPKRNPPAPRTGRQGNASHSVRVACRNYFGLSAHPSSCLPFNYSFCRSENTSCRGRGIISASTGGQGTGRIHSSEVRAKKKMYSTLT